MSQALSPADDALLGRYLDELRAWSGRVNLVGSAAPDALRRHVRDALAVAEALRPGARVVDLGSGAGFPGVPLAIARPDVRLTLVEIRERRFHFLRHVARELGLSCTVLRGRIEDPPAAPFDLALLRAVAPPLRAVALARPWVECGGEIWIWARERPEGLAGSPGGDISLGQRGVVLRVPVRPAVDAASAGARGGSSP